MAVAHNSPFFYHWVVLPVTSRLDVPSLQSVRTRPSPNATSSPRAHHGIPQPPCTPPRRYHGQLIGANYCQVSHRPPQSRHDCELICLYGIYHHWHCRQQQLAVALEQHVMVDMKSTVQTVCLITSQQEHSNMLAQHWGIPFHTHHSMWHEEHCQHHIDAKILSQPPHALLSRLPPHDVHWYYVCSTMSWRGSKCAQIFKSNFGWSYAYPMKTKSKAHDALSLVFQHEHVPPLMVMDGLKEQTLGKFWQKQEDHWTLLPLAECCQMWDQGSQERTWLETPPDQHSLQTLGWLTGK